MRRRFTDVEKWQDEWFQELDNSKKLIWLYLLDTCTNAGRWKKNFKLLNFCCNMTIDDKSLKEMLNGRMLDYETFYFIPKFLKFQYPKGLNSYKPAIIAVREELINYNLTDKVIEIYGNDYLIIKEKKQKREQIIQEKKEVYRNPTIEMVEIYFKELNASSLEAKKFYDYFESNGWKIGGKASMKNWKAAIRNWVRRLPPGSVKPKEVIIPLKREEISPEGQAKVKECIQELKNKMGKV
jgi:hypothetical protein